jgi:outer membrane lipoprotein-sorting protein
MMTIGEAEKAAKSPHDPAKHANGGHRVFMNVEVSMRTVALTACLGVLASVLATVATAQSVPLPKPSPDRAAAANDPIAEILRPPGAVPNSRPGGPVNSPPSGPTAATPAPPPSSNDQRASASPARPGETIAFDAKQRALVDRVSAYLSAIQTLVGDFVQIGPDGGRTEGQFYIQKPGKVRFEYNPPSPTDVIADGQTVVVRNRVLGTQDPYPLSQTPLRFLLSDHIDLMKDTSVTSVSADDVFVTVVIEEKQPIIGTSRLMMMFGAKDFQLRQWTVSDPQGYDTTVAVYNLDTSSKPDPSMFKITYERSLQ